MENNDEAKKMGERISEKRVERGLTQQELAVKLNRSSQAISNWETGKNRPSADMLNKIAALLGAPIEFFYGNKPAYINVFEKRWELSDTLFSVEHMRNKVTTYAKDNNFYQTIVALSLMDLFHKGQYRLGKDSIPHISHPLMMACHAIALGLYKSDDSDHQLQDDLLSIILLHDVLDDCNTSVEELYAIHDLRPEIVNTLYLLSDKYYAELPREERKKLFFQNLAQNKLALMVKSLSYCNNVSTMATAFSNAKMANYIDDIEYYLLPLLDEQQLVDISPQFKDSLFIIKYHILGVVESIKHILSNERI